MIQFKHPEDVFLAQIQGKEADCVNCAFFITATLRPWCHKHDKNPKTYQENNCPDFKYKRK